MLLSVHPATACIALTAVAATSLAQPLNDICDAPTAVDGYATVAWDTTDATTDGIANPACLPRTDGQIYGDVWFRWTAPSNGPAVISTCGGTIMDTRLSIFAGPTCPATVPFLCNDNACSPQSALGFSAVAGATYLVRLGSGVDGVHGTGTLTFGSGLVAGPIASLDGASEYFLVAASTWDQGEAISIAMGGHLATISSLDENEFIRDSVLSFDGRPRRAWIGLHSPLQDGVFVWSSGDASPFRHWIPGEPNNLEGVEYSVEMVNTLGLPGEWNDAPSDHAPTRHALVEVPATTLCAADLDDNGVFEDGGHRDGAVTIDDLLFFLVGFESGDPAVDLDNDGDPAVGVPDGAVEINDLLFFISRFESGC
jgi:hypothetical protein